MGERAEFFALSLSFLFLLRIAAADTVRPPAADAAAAAAAAAAHIPRPAASRVIRAPGRHAGHSVFRRGFQVSPDTAAAPDGPVGLLLRGGAVLVTTGRRRRSESE